MLKLFFGTVSAFHGFYQQVSHVTLYSATAEIIQLMIILGDVEAPILEDFVMDT